MQRTITAAIITGATTEDISKHFKLTTEESEQLCHEVEMKLADQDISDADFQDWCDATDQKYPTIEV